MMPNPKKNMPTHSVLTGPVLTESHLRESFRVDVKKRSDKLMDYFLAGFFLTGLGLAFCYDTWLIAFGVGSLSLLAYYSVKWMLPASDLYQYVLSVVLAIFMAQYIYQMHGLFEMHFFAFIGSAILITYQKWKLQIPMFLIVAAHHAGFNYLQRMGYNNIYFTQLNFLDNQTFVIHILLTAVIFYICGLWAYQLNLNGEVQVSQAAKMAKLQEEAAILLERQRNEEVLRQAYLQAEKGRREAEQANQAKSIFLATMSHEIRTPMNGVIGMASLLAETALSDQQKMYTQTIATCGESLLNVINDILDFSKIESGSMELEKEDFDLRTCIEDVLEIFGTRAAESGLDLVYQIDPAVPLQIVGDDLRIRQVLTNLVGNAIKFTREGEVFVGVKAGSPATDGGFELVFEVRDTGIGIAADKLERLFKAFSQVDSSTTRKYGGTGLGLAISEKLVRLMDGRITVESTPGKGSVFSFTIQTRRGTKLPQTPATCNLSDHEGKRILVVDDNETNRTILKNQLEYWKLAPVLAASGQEALNILSVQSPFDLVLSDMQMPGMDGAQLAETIRGRYPHLSVILLSSIGEEYSKKDSGLFSSVLTKPIKQHVLCRHILTGLERRGPAAGEGSPAHNKLPPDLSRKYPLKILVAEDNLINQQVIVHILQKMGYEPEVAENGLEVMEAAGQQSFDIILMDLQMPEMDGLEATKLIRKKPGRQPVIIALTANTMEGDEKECLDAGMNDYIGKPVRLEDIVAKLQKWALQGMLDKV